MISKIAAWRSIPTFIVLAILAEHYVKIWDVESEASFSVIASYPALPIILSAVVIATLYLSDKLSERGRMLCYAASVAGIVLLIISSRIIISYPASAELEGHWPFFSEGRQAINYDDPSLCYRLKWNGFTLGNAQGQTYGNFVGIPYLSFEPSQFSQKLHVGKCS